MAGINSLYMGICFVVIKKYLIERSLVTERRKHYNCFVNWQRVAAEGLAIVSASLRSKAWGILVSPQKPDCEDCAWALVPIVCLRDTWDGEVLESSFSRICSSLLSCWCWISCCQLVWEDVVDLTWSSVLLQDINICWIWTAYTSGTS